MLFDVPYALTAGPSMKEGLMETRSNLYSVLKSQASFSARVCMRMNVMKTDIQIEAAKWLQLVQALLKVRDVKTFSREILFHA